MRPITLRRADLAGTELDGLVLCQDVAGSPEFGKGRVLRAGDAESLLGLDWSELHLVEPGPGDLHEDDAGRRLAEAAAGDGVAVGALHRGQWPLTAGHRGLVDVEVESLTAANRQEGVAIYTATAGRVVDVGEAVARARSLPFVLPEERVAAVEALAAETNGLVRVRPFAAHTVAVVVLERLGPEAAAAFVRTVGEKLDWLGARHAPPDFVDPEPAAVGAALDSARGAGAGIIVVAGARAADPLDPAFVALEALGGRVARYGVPIHPGSFLWLGWLDEVTVVGMPSCGVFSKATSFDIVLPRLLAGIPADADAIAELGSGGLLDPGTDGRLPPYRPDGPRGLVG